LAEYNIQLPTFGCQVTDNASNMVKAFELFSVHAQLASDGQGLTSRPNSRVLNVDEHHESDDENVDGSCLLDVEDSEYSDELLSGFPRFRLIRVLKTQMM